MRYSLKNSFRKLLTYCFVLGIKILIILTLIEFFSRNSRANENLVEYIGAANTTTKAIFIGSSKIQASINPVLLKQQLPQYNFYNLGLSGSSVLYNCHLAERLIPTVPSGSLVFVELSDFRLSPSGYFYHFNTQKDLYEITKKRIALSIGFNELESIFFSFINIRPQLKASMSSDKAFLKEVGFTKWKTTYTGKENTFINSTDVLNTDKSLSTLQNKYLLILNELIAEGKKKNVKIVFILPLNIKGTEKKKELLPIFHAIPVSNKWIYSSNLLRTISFKKYLGDIIHLNETGAKLYSAELAREISRSDQL